MTAYRTEGVVLVDGAQSLDGRRRATDCFDWSDLLLVGQSRGFNRVLPGVAGTSRRDHVRDELMVELQWRCNGTFNADGTLGVQASGRLRTLQYVASVRDFLDGATGRQLKLDFYGPDAEVSQVNVTFKAMGRVRFVSPTLAEFATMLAVPSGIVPLPEPEAAAT